MVTDTDWGTQTDHFPVYNLEQTHYHIQGSKFDLKQYLQVYMAWKHMNVGGLGFLALSAMLSCAREMHNSIALPYMLYLMLWHVILYNWYS